MLLLIGDGDEEQNIRNYIKYFNLCDRVMLLGWKNNPYPYIKSARLLVLTSDFEGLPTVLIEALSLNTPVVSTDCPCGPSEILQGKLSRFLVPLNDVKSLADAMSVALENYPEIDQVLLNKFSVQSVCDKYLKIINDFAGHRR